MDTKDLPVVEIGIGAGAALLLGVLGYAAVKSKPSRKNALSTKDYVQATRDAFLDAEAMANMLPREKDFQNAIRYAGPDGVIRVAELGERTARAANTYYFQAAQAMRDVRSLQEEPVASRIIADIEAALAQGAVLQADDVTVGRGKLVSYKVLPAGDELRRNASNREQAALFVKLVGAAEARAALTEKGF